MKPARKAEALISDEAGVQRGTETEQIILFDVINRRYRYLRPTIFLTNARGQALRDYLGVRTIDRMVERSIVVPFQWESHRTRKG